MGYKAAELAAELLNLSFSEDEEVVCITETDSCT
ncbi:MAG: formylmethanofuran dehydrogenase, partial [Methanomicrobium sp.]|nr:formylmethanofuran dehydrogenase [Methanomicrobium sp.]